MRPLPNDARVLLLLTDDCLVGLLAQVVTEEASTPFAIVTRRETGYGDYKGIAMDLMQARTRCPVQGRGSVVVFTGSFAGMCGVRVNAEAVRLPGRRPFRIVTHPEISGAPPLRSSVLIASHPKTGFSKNQS